METLGHKIRITRNFFHVTVDGWEIAIAKGIGNDRLTEVQAVGQAIRIAKARKAGRK